jgi:hypothetical protein
MKFNLLLNDKNIESSLYLVGSEHKGHKSLDLCFWVFSDQESKFTKFMTELVSNLGITSRVELSKAVVATSPICSQTRTEYSYNFNDTIEKIDLIVSKFGFKLKL